MGESVRVERDGPIAAIRLDRPPMNALSAQVQDELAAAAAPTGTGLEIERLRFAGLFATEDQRTGMRSFIENGPGKATFTGR